MSDGVRSFMSKPGVKYISPTDFFTHISLVEGSY